MPCIEDSAPRRVATSPVGRAVLLLLATLAGACSQSPTDAPPARTAVAPATGEASSGGASRTPARAVPSAAPGPPLRGPTGDWDSYRVAVAERIVAMNPAATYLGPVAEPLLAIPVLEIELEVDGRVRRIDVLREPGQAGDTVQLAIAAVRRAAPFGSVSHLPRPWKFTETFLFDEQRRFKPRSLDT